MPKDDWIFVDVFGQFGTEEGVPVVRDNLLGGRESRVKCGDEEERVLVCHLVPGGLVEEGLSVLAVCLDETVFNQFRRVASSDEAVCQVDGMFFKIFNTAADSADPEELSVRDAFDAVPGVGRCV